ncbi:MAG: ammonium transporter [Verrucomicrobiota bacterium]
MSLDFTSVVLAGVLVMLVQAGFALVTTGLCRAKNAAQVITINLIIFALSIVGFWVCGFAFMSGGWSVKIAPQDTEWSIHLFGHSFGLMGHQGFFLSAASSPLLLSLFFFQATVVAVAALIPAGVMADRWKFSSVIPYACVSAALPIAVFGNWVWGGGWLAQLGENLGCGHGFVDFAGSSVIHMAGGVAGFMGAIALGPRVGKYSRDGRPRPMPGHNLAFVVFGALLLAAGWFGMTIGPSLFAAPSRLPLIAVNTLLSAAAAAATACAVVKIKFKKPDPSMICNGLLAGLAAISGPCAFVNPAGAVLTGAVAGALVVYCVVFIEGTIKVDDPVGALSVHGVGGAWGLLSLGLFADGSFGQGWNGVHDLAANGTETGVTGAFGALFGAPSNDWSQLGAQIIGAAACLIFCGLAAWLWFKICAFFTPLRCRHEEELAGLDLPEVGAECYPDFHLTDKGSTRAD